MGGAHARVVDQAESVNTITLRAPAKLNWTLEVLRARPDGYHELRSVMQTVDLCDEITLMRHDRIELEVRGDPPLADEPPERNLAFRAADALRRRAGVDVGVRIVLEKRIPVAAGLGGGSSDAAAVLRGCNTLWNARLDDGALSELAKELGSDVPFFLFGGTAAIAGRGDVVEPLDDAVAADILLATPPAGDRGEKTAAMFAALSPDDFTEGDATAALREAVGAGRPIADGMLMNAFERVLTRMQPETERAMDALRAQRTSARLAGAGPSFFVVLDHRDGRAALMERTRELGFEPRVARTLSRESALEMRRS